MCASYVLWKSYKFKSFTSTSTRSLSTSVQENRKRDYINRIISKPVINAALKRQNPSRLYWEISCSMDSRWSRNASLSERKVWKNHARHGRWETVQGERVKDNTYMTAFVRKHRYHPWWMFEFLYRKQVSTTDRL